MTEGNSSSRAYFLMNLKEKIIYNSNDVRIGIRPLHRVNKINTYVRSCTGCDFRLASEVRKMRSETNMSSSSGTTVATVVWEG
jgi:hypothetical protein